jgi:hypothetical protein
VHELCKSRGVTIFFPPELSHLPQSSLNSRMLAVSIPGGQFIFQFRAGTLGPRWETSALAAGAAVEPCMSASHFLLPLTEPGCG